MKVLPVFFGLILMGVAVACGSKNKQAEPVSNLEYSQIFGGQTWTSEKGGRILFAKETPGLVLEFQEKITKDASVCRYRHTSKRVSLSKFEDSSRYRVQYTLDDVQLVPSRSNSDGCKRYIKKQRERLRESPSFTREYSVTRSEAGVTTIKDLTSGAELKTVEPSVISKPSQNQQCANISGRYQDENDVSINIELQIRQEDCETAVIEKRSFKDATDTIGEVIETKTYKVGALVKVSTSQEKTVYIHTQANLDAVSITQIEESGTLPQGKQTHLAFRTLPMGDLEMTTVETGADGKEISRNSVVKYRQN